MNRKWFVLILLSVIVFLSGCLDQKVEVEYDNDNPIAFTYFGISRAEPRPNQTTSIEFWVTNQAELDVEDVEIRLFDPRGFQIEEISCGFDCKCNEKNPDNSCGDGVSCADLNTCKFEKLQSLDAKIVHITLRAPLSEGFREISFSAKYDFSGTSILTFPILDSMEEKTSAKKHFSPALGPVKVEIDAGFEMSRIVEGRKETITDWTREGEMFTMDLNVKNIGNLGFGHTYPKFSIDTKDFEVDLINVHQKGECEFEGEDKLKPKENVSVPTEIPLKCDLVADEISQPRVTGMIITDYSYRYEFIRKQAIEVKK